MEWSTWFALVAACCVFSLSPGAGAILTMHNAINVHVSYACKNILGLQAGIVLHLMIVFFGVGSVIAASDLAYDVIKYAGGCYFIYLGLNKIFAQKSANTEIAEQKHADVFMHGFITNVVNPKSILFLAAFVPNFIDFEQQLFIQYMIISFTIIAIDCCVMFGYASCALVLKRYLDNPKHLHRLNCVFGILFIGVAVLLLLSHRTG